MTEDAFRLTHINYIMFPLTVQLLLDMFGIIFYVDYILTDILIDRNECVGQRAPSSSCTNSPIVAHTYTSTCYTSWIPSDVQSFTLPILWKLSEINWQKLLADFELSWQKYHFLIKTEQGVIFLSTFKMQSRNKSPFTSLPKVNSETRKIIILSKRSFISVI